LALADGPVGFSSLPGGANFTSSDNGSGETWGRAGGVDWTYNTFDLTLFDNLTWGAVDSSSVGIAFDGTINSGTQEVLSLTSIIGNQATWSGQARFRRYINGLLFDVIAETRLVLTVTSGGGPLNLEVNTVNGLPYANVISANGQFVANLGMEARLSGTTAWEGALDLFDRLDTTGDGLVITSFNNGFFFDLAGSGGDGLSLEEHDANMVNQAGSIAGDLEFLTIESVNRLTDLGVKADTLEDLVRGLSNNELTELLGRAGTIDQLVRDLTDLHSGGPDAPSSDEIRQIVEDSRNELTQIITFLWGVAPGGEGFPDPDDVPQISELSTQESVDALALLLSDLFAVQGAQIVELNAQIDDLQQQLVTLEVLPSLTLEVIGSNRGSKKTRRLLILSRENGVPTQASGFTINAVVENKSDGFSLAAVSYTSRIIGQGLVEVDLSLPKSLKSTKIFHITAEHDHGGGDSHSGATIVGGSPGATD
jgi:hypothetical protein